MSANSEKCDRPDNNKPRGPRGKPFNQIKTVVGASVTSMFSACVYQFGNGKERNKREHGNNRNILKQ